MSENTVVITERDGKYHIQNNGISEFALIGILESIVFDMKMAKRAEASTISEPSGIKQETEIKTAPEIKPETAKEIQSSAPAAPALNPNTPDLRTRIGNAIKAVRSLGGEVPDFDAENATEEELREELEALTEQYKRLKNSKAAKK